jgi:hypothetical protein
MNKLYFGFIIFILSLTSCNSRYKKETNAFRGYLSETFNEKIPPESHEYILISQFQCSGCVQRILIDISNNLNGKQNDSITVITFKLDKVPEILKKKVTVLLDEDAKYEHFLSIANVAIVKTNRSQIIDIKIVNLDDIE